VVGESPAPKQQAPTHSIVTLKVSDGTAAPAATQPAAKTSSPSQATAPAQTTVAAQTTTPAQTTATSTSQSATATSAASARPASASVPDVAGRQVKSAAASLARAGFLISIAYVPATDPLGTVIAMSPLAGQTAETGSHVTINAASGPGQKARESVPDAAGMSIPAAVAAMQHAGLRLILLRKTVSDQALAGKVVEQTPAAGSTAPHNAQVLVYMGAFRTATTKEEG
jgi:beta-lactam-binding protein with PASTA domain